ncbi:MAG: N-acetyltransferase [Deltaproteobacteria bacterium]|jgi:amino-acid N-acetyltransferase|nr:N-acetyltransferase [Deltaproteobacteria bacterium]
MGTFYYVRKALATDVGAIYELLKGLAAEGLLLPRSYTSLYEMLQTLYVAVSQEGQFMLGVGALQVSWEDLAEVRSLAIRDGFRGLGVGRAITTAIEEDARALLIRRLFALTYEPEFFFRLGYRQVGLDSLPQKIWAVCFNCVHYPDCKEIAVVKELDPLLAAREPDPSIKAAALKEGAVAPGPLPGGRDAPAGPPLNGPSAPAGPPIGGPAAPAGPLLGGLGAQAGLPLGGPGAPVGPLAGTLRPRVPRRRN